MTDSSALRAGCFLVATSSLTDPHFTRTVVYIAEHNHDGTLGFIINRPLEVPLRDLWTECPEGLASIMAAAEGGPVEPNKGLLLHRDGTIPAAIEMGPGIYVGGDLSALAKRFSAGIDHHGPRLFLGHSGWGPGQLDQEIVEGAWLVRPGDTAWVTAADNTTLWQRLANAPTGGAQRLPKPSMN